MLTPSGLSSVSGESEPPGFEQGEILWHKAPAFVSGKIVEKLRAEIAELNSWPK
jgi:hypothetical protein